MHLKKENSSAKKIVLILTVLFLFSFLALLLIVNTGHQGFIIPLVKKIPGRDKTGHFFIMGFLSLLINLCFEAKQFRLCSFNFLKGSFFVYLFVTAEEFSQLLLPHRNFAWDDLLMNYLGVFCFGHLALFLASYFSLFETTKSTETTITPT